MKGLAPQQRAVLEFCWNFYDSNDQLPPRHLIANHFGWASVNAAEATLQALETKGMVARNAVNKFKFTKAARQLLAEGVAA